MWKTTEYGFKSSLTADSEPQYNGLVLLISLVAKYKRFKYGAHAARMLLTFNVLEERS